MSVALFSSFQYILLLILLPQTTPFVNVLPTQQEFPSLSPETAVDMLKLYDSNIQSSSDYKSPSSLLNTIISSHPSHPLSFLVDLKTRSWSKDFRDVCRTALSPPTAGIEPIVTLGICAGCPSEALRTLQGWVAGLNLSKGLVMELDRDGILIGDDDEFYGGKSGGTFLRYKSRGLRTFKEMRSSGLGFSGLWRDGDAVAEAYTGGFRGVYLGLLDGYGGDFFQVGVLPLELFLEEI